MKNASRGDVWYVNLDPVQGHEQGGRRPALVISDDKLNHGPAGLVVVIPITTTDKRIPSHFRVEPPEGGLTSTSFIKCEDIRSISTARLANRAGRVSQATMTQVEELVLILLGM